MKLKVNEGERREATYMREKGMLLFVFLAVSVPVACDAAESFSVLGPHEPISVHMGSTVTLPCWLSPPHNAETMEIRWYLVSFNDTALLYRGGQLQDSSQNPRFRGRAFLGSRGPEAGGLKGGDVSLRLDNVTVEDEGEFQCYVSSDQHYETARITLNVMVTGMAPVLSMRQAGDDRLNVSCASSGWHPRPKLVWSDSEGRSGLAPGALLYSPEKQGRFSVSSWILAPPSDAGWLSCSVLSEGGEREGRVALLSSPYTSKPDDQSGQWKAAFIALLILGLLAAGIFAFLFIRNKRNGSKPTVENPSETVPLLKTDTKKKGLPKIIDFDEASKEKVNITLDQNTAHALLKLTTDGKRVRDTDEPQGRPISEKTFTKHMFVLGREGFASGRAYWEVGLWNPQKGLKLSWSVGVVSASAKRDCDVVTPSEGYWIFSSDKDNGLHVNSVSEVSLCDKLRPHTLGVFLDYKQNMISFYNVEERSHMLTLFTIFHETVYPLFGPGMGDNTPLVITSFPDESPESNTNAVTNEMNELQPSSIPTTTSDSPGVGTTSPNSSQTTPLSVDCE